MNQKKRKYYARNIKRYKFVDDRILMYSDEDVHDKMVSEFREQLGKDGFTLKKNSRN